MKSPNSSHIHAVLGPTNTGKTHYALSRLTAHETGIIGFPLRLLARENYEKLVKLKGEASVALITGEEKIIPPKARWFSCTVEAMPLNRKVNFIAIDEIQLAADPDRGHIFTDRLLYSRGKEETLLLGSETIRPLLKQLIPSLKIDTRPRLSQLSNIGHISLTKLPPRSAIVAFSAHEVYALAEIIRQKRGGCAVIMGRLSPRTRNAQIALYQNRDVDYLVATDAIGMGLNMDVDHVALAALHKFDGQNMRSLTAQEMAQIVGRAGRGMKEGTFGTTANCAPMSQELIHKIENHQFDTLKQISWRNNQLNYQNPEALLKSLNHHPPKAGLTMGRIASDLDILQHLITLPEIITKAKGAHATATLWEFCQIPDFKKNADGSHAHLCGRLFLEMMEHSHIPTQWIDGQLRGLDKIEGDIDTLMHRLSAVRVCAYVSARSNWIKNHQKWQKKSQDVEERLSDALHERLTTRFVNKRATALLRRSDPSEHHQKLYAVTADDRIIVEGHDIGQIKGFSLEIDQSSQNSEESALLQRMGQRALRTTMPQRIHLFLKEPLEAFHLTEEGTIIWRNAPIAKLIKTENFFKPDLALMGREFQDTHQTKLILDKLRIFLKEKIQDEFKLFFQLLKFLDSTPAYRGIAHRLYEDGSVTKLLSNEKYFTPKQRQILKRQGLVIGLEYGFVPSLLKPKQSILLTLLFRLYHHLTLQKCPIITPQRCSYPLKDYTNLQTPPIGWLIINPILLRLDIYEKIRTLLVPASKKEAALRRPLPNQLATLLAVKATLLPEILKSLQIPFYPASSLPPNLYGPPAPLMLAPYPYYFKKPQKYEKKERHFALRKNKKENSPFSILETWKKRA